MDKKIILFDIDKTLLNPFLSLKDFENEVQNEFKKKINILEAYDEYIQKLDSSTDFYPKDFLEFISKKIEVSFKELERKFYNSEIWESYVYKDVIDTLNRVKSNFELGIFSEGFKSFQGRKLKMSKLNTFFKKDLLFISRRKLNSYFLEKLPKGSIIIDDNKEVVEKLRDLNRFEVFWLNRIDDQKIDGVETIKSLKDLEKLI